ncbi:MAG: sulfite exporter TauE/SafE family protein [Burkholderiaceae bacterium]
MIEALTAPPYADAATVALIAAIFVLAGFVKGVVGMGLPTVAVGLLGLFMAPVQAAALLIIPSLVTNVWQLLGGPSLRRIGARLATMLIGVLAGTIALAGLMQAGSGGGARLALGLSLLAYALAGLARVRFTVTRARERWLSPLIGAVTGGISAATGVFVVPAVAYLQSLDLGKEELIQALGLSFTVSTIGLAIGLGAQGRFDGATTLRSLLALLPALAGMAIGTALRRRLSEAAFRRGFFVGLALLGAHLIYGAWR